MARIAIYLPCTSRNYGSVRTDLQDSFCELYGGFTGYHATGGWKDPNGKIITESVYVLESYTDKSVSSLRMDLELITAWVKAETNEESVAYTINSDMYFN